jgi:DNA polymerase-1
VSQTDIEQATSSPEPAASSQQPAANTLLLVDGHALVYRAYHALPPDLRTSKGEATNAVLGFTGMLLDTLRLRAPRYAVVTFDKGRTFRHDQFAEYKAQRGPMPDDLRDQLHRVREMVEALGIPIMEQEGYEADDLIGTLAKQAEGEGLDTYILTADTDQHQLVSEHVRLIAPGGYKQRFSEARIYDLEAVHERYGFGPELVPDYKALVGDKTDNIPNVPGIGEKGASQLLNQYGSLEGVIEHVDELKPKIAESLREHTEQARQSKEIATIDRNAPVSLDLEASKVQGFDRERVLRLLQELEFRSLVNKVYQVEAALAPYGPQAQGGVEQTQESGDGARSSQVDGGPHQMSLFESEQPSTPDTQPPAATSDRRSTLAAFDDANLREVAGVPGNVVIVRDKEGLQRLAEKLKGAGRFTVDVEATSQDDMDADLVGIAIYIPDGGASPSPDTRHPTPDTRSDTGYYVSVGHAGEDTGKQLSVQEVKSILGPLFVSEDMPKDGHNLKYDSKVLKRAGVPLHNLGADTMIAAYLLGETGLSLKDLAFTRLGIQMVPISELIGPRKSQTTMDQVPVEKAAPYATADVAVTEKLRATFEPELRESELDQLMAEIEMPLVEVLTDMELVGVAIDVPWLQRLSTQMHTKLGELQESIYEEAKHPFNINSTQQFGKVLFEELGLPGRKRTQTGYSTDREVLDKLRGLHPIVDLVIEYRQLVKLKNTYVDALPLLVRRDTGRVHTSFNQCVAATGRLSSAQPNLQNIPIRTELGRDVRKAFIADNESKHRLFDEESVLLAVDYSQIELRLLAHMAKEERLIAAFEQGLDIHAATAAEVMGVPIEQVDPDSRRLAKTINFGVLYGMGSYGLARDSGLTQEEAAKFIDLYWSRYPAVRAYMDNTLREGRERGYVSTLLGRRRYMPELRSRNGGIRQQAERMAINAPVQGTAADIIKIAMNRLYDRLREGAFKGQMLLQVHDELLFEVPRSELERIAPLVCETMEGAMELDVPLKVEMKWGKNWGEMQGLTV